MRAKKRLYDFVDFEECVSKHGIAVAMAADDFYDFKNHLSQGNDTSYPYCSDVRVFQVQKDRQKCTGRASMVPSILSQVSLSRNSSEQK